mmetsp:Transcript_26475/g.58002  ORF Transcript_26475/g.58002 Transcript_26475/m.58002 type:complete len:346 (+) Transcript_26475:156-1193(+)
MEHQRQDQESMIVHNLSAALHQKEAEAAELREALKDLLDSHVRAKHRQAKELSSMHKRYSKRLVQLEIDLETHDIHFTNYAKDQMELETKGILEYSNNYEREEPKNDSQAAQQHLISKLISDHAELEYRYKRDCADDAERIRELEDDNRRLHQSLRHGSDIGSRNNISKPTEGRPIIYDSSRNENDNDHTHVLQRLEKENAELSRSVNELKEKIHGLEFKHILCGNGNDAKDENGNELSCIDSDRSKIVLLQKEMKMKDHKIALLRTKAIAYQARNLWPPTKDHDGTHVLNSCSVALSPSSLSQSSPSMVIQDLKQQIQELEDIIIRKDKELRSQTKSCRKKRVS